MERDKKGLETITSLASRLVALNPNVYEFTYEDIVLLLQKRNY